MLFHRSLGEIGQDLGGLTVGGMSQTRKRLRLKLENDKDLSYNLNKCIVLIEDKHR